MPERRAQVLSRLVENVRMRAIRRIAGSRRRREGFQQCWRSFLGMGLIFVEGSDLEGLGGV